MKILLVVLLLACAGGGFPNSELGQKTPNADEAFLNSDTLLDFHDKIDGLQEKVMANLELSPEQKAQLPVLLQQIGDITNDHINPNGDSIEEINEKNNVGDLLYQSDIVPTSNQVEEILADIENGGHNRTKRQALRDHRYPKNLWLGGMNYYFDSSATAVVRSVFKKATQLWMKDTCIDIHENSAAVDKVRVFKGEGCWSSVGKRGGVQALSLGRGCESVFSAAHEIGHVLGFVHAQSRHDRDSYITVNTENIKGRYMRNYIKESKDTNYNYELPYDYGSIMHYGTRSSSANGKPTMVPHDPKYVKTLGSPFISFYDLLMINRHYNCTERCNPDTSAKCAMGGFPHPRNCSKCICPGGYGGTLCDERPSGCGSTYQANSSYQVLDVTIGNINKGRTFREDMDICNYWITAPLGSKIEVKFVSISRGFAVDGCQYGGVEIKAQADQRLTGYRFCSKSDAITLVSEHNIVPIITYNRLYASRIYMQYRIAPNTGAKVAESHARPSGAEMATIRCTDNNGCGRPASS